MKIAVCLVGTIVCYGFAHAAELDTLALLKRDLGKTIEVISEREIRYCPDNTCEIYSIQDTKTAAYFPSFVYLYLFHQGNYIYLKESVGGSRPFRQAAKDAEPLVRKQAEEFCLEEQKTPTCILDGMKKALGVTVSFGRYDEGTFRIECLSGGSCVTVTPPDPVVSRLLPPGPPPVSPPSIPPPARVPDF